MVGAYGAMRWASRHARTDIRFNHWLPKTEERQSTPSKMDAEGLGPHVGDSGVKVRIWWWFKPNFQIHMPRNVKSQPSHKYLDQKESADVLIDNCAGRLCWYVGKVETTLAESLSWRDRDREREKKREWNKNEKRLKTQREGCKAKNLTIAFTMIWRARFSFTCTFCWTILPSLQQRLWQEKGSSWQTNPWVGTCQSGLNPPWPDSFSWTSLTPYVGGGPLRNRRFWVSNGWFFCLQLEASYLNELSTKVLNCKQQSSNCK